MNYDSISKQIKIFADGADLETAEQMISEYGCKGFTTNPTLMQKAGIENYESFARDLISASGGYPVSFEVFADDLPEMERQARIIHEWGGNIYVKIPITNTQGIPTYSLIKKLNEEGIKINVTAIFTYEQIDGLWDCLNPNVPAIVSIFAGRIANAGEDPAEMIKYAVRRFKNKSPIEILWASTREAYNVVQAKDAGCHIITVVPGMIKSLNTFGKDLGEYSLDTVKMFREDAIKSGFQI